MAVLKTKQASRSLVHGLSVHGHRNALGRFAAAAAAQASRVSAAAAV